MTQYSVLPRSVKAHESARAAVIRSLVGWLSQAWPVGRPMEPTLWFERFGSDYAERATLAQLEVALLAAWSVDDVLRAQGVDVEPASVAVERIASTDGAGRPVLGQAYASAGAVGGAVAWAEQTGELPVTQALSEAWRSAGMSLVVATQTMVSDASRAAKSVSMVNYDAGWVRVLTPPSCSRCAVLGGKFFRNPTAGFDRHPGCDCTQMPVPSKRSELAQKLMVEPKDYFDSLSAAQQDKIFTKAGAQAIRDGADVNQVVNARRGMSKATDNPRLRDTSDEGITKRGWAYQYLRPSYEASLRKEPGYRYRRLDRRRLMPERIYELAGGDRDTALMLLHQNGFLTDASPRLRGTQSYFPRDADVALATERARAKLRARGVTPRN